MSNVLSRFNVFIKDELFENQSKFHQKNDLNFVRYDTMLISMCHISSLFDTSGADITSCTKNTL